MESIERSGVQVDRVFLVVGNVKYLLHPFRFSFFDNDGQPLLRLQRYENLGEQYFKLTHEQVEEIRVHITHALSRMKPRIMDTDLDKLWKAMQETVDETGKKWYDKTSKAT